MGKAERRKATEYQAEVAKWLAARGWRVVNLPIGGRWRAVRDVFGVDIIAKHRDRCVTLWIQATADPKVSWKRKSMAMELVPWYWPIDRAFVFKKKGSHHWEVRRLGPQGLELFGNVLLGQWVPAGKVRFEF